LLTNRHDHSVQGLHLRSARDPCVTLGKRITARRLALGWSQNELARRAEVNHPTLFKIEAGQRLNPSISIVVRIARALGTTAEALYGWGRDDTHLIVEANKNTMLVDVRPLGKKSGEASQARAKSFVVTALELAGAKVRDGARTGEDASEAPSPAHAAQLAAGGLALVEELRAIRRRLDALESPRQGQEGRVRKRASR
jgi:transcriptional regulator with XRE-family HTH domain